MKRILIFLLACLLGLVFVLAVFNVIDSTAAAAAGNEYNHAFVSLPNGDCVDGPIQNYRVYSNGVTEVFFTDGTVYSTHSSNVVIILGD